MLPQYTIFVLVDVYPIPAESKDDCGPAIYIQHLDDTLRTIHYTLSFYYMGMLPFDVSFHCYAWRGVARPPPFDGE